MREVFPAYYLLDPATLEALWKEAVIVLDANVLLDLYRYPIQARDDLLAVLQKVGDRLFVPYQAALEYQRGRLGVIASQLKRFDEVRQALTDTENKLYDDFGRLQLKKRHASIDPEKLLSELKMLFDSFRQNLEKLEPKQQDVSAVDEIRAQLDVILKGRVGGVPTQGDLDAIYLEGKKRYERKQPPGYLDSGKAREKEPIYISHGLKIERQYGDLILWRQIIEYASEKHIKQLIFVTDDKKSDWWLEVDSKGTKTIGPRIELIEEIHAEANVEVFHIYPSTRFLEFGRQYLGVKVEEESIEQVRDLKRPDHLFPAIEPTRRFAALAVRKWLSTMYPGKIIYHGPGISCDYLIDVADGSKFSFDVQVTRTGLPSRLRTKTLELAETPQPVNRRFIVWVSAVGPFPERGLEALRQLALPADMHLYCGHLESLKGQLDQQFVLDAEVPESSPDIDSE